MTNEEMFDSSTRSKGDLAGVFEYDGETGYFYSMSVGVMSARRWRARSSSCLVRRILRKRTLPCVGMRAKRWLGFSFVVSSAPFSMLPAEPSTVATTVEGRRPICRRRF